MCLFCNTQTEEYVLSNSLAYARWDGYPVNEGHLLIIPKRHVASFFECTAEEVLAIYKLLHEGEKLINKQLNPDGYNIGINIGEDSGQSIFHVHVHLIPRYKGDVENPKGGIRNLKEALVKY